MNIIIFDNLLFFPHRAKVVSLETKNFLHFLLEDEYFQNEQKQLRKKYDIPESGFPIEKLYSSIEIRDKVIEGLPFETLEEFHRLLDEMYNSNEVIFAPQEKLSEVIDRRKIKLDKFVNSLPQAEQKAINHYFIKQKQEVENEDDETFLKNLKNKKHKEGFSIRETQREMESDLARLTQHYNLPSDFRKQFFMLIAFNAFQNIYTQLPFLFMATKVDILDEVQKSKDPIGALLIYEQTSKNQLIKWIEDNWSIIKDLMQDLPIVSHQKSTILDISKEIADLREKKSMTYKEISNYLYEKYPDDERVTDEVWVKETYKRYKDRVQAFTKKK